MEHNDVEIKNYEGNNEWQVAVDKVPVIAKKCHQLIELASENPAVLKINKWESHLRNSESPRIESFSSLSTKSERTPDGVGLNITISYPNTATETPKFLTIYGESSDGYFAFTYHKDAPNEKGTEKIEIEYEREPWLWRISHSIGNEKSLDIYLNLKTDSEADRFLAKFKGLSFDSQGRIALNRENLTLGMVIHMVYGSIWRDNVPFKDFESLLSILRQADKARKEILKKDPEAQKTLDKRGVKLPTSNYADLQSRRLNTVPLEVDWRESLGMVQNRIGKALESLSTSLQA